MDTAFESPSQQELNDRSGSREPLVADDYIIKLAKISLVAGPTWTKTGQINRNVLKPVWKIIGLVYGLKGGGTMLDMKGIEIEPLTRWLFKDNVDPFAVGFGGNDKSIPSFVRTIICYLSNIPIQERLKTKEFIMLKGTQEITDTNLKMQWLAQAKDPAGPQNLLEEYRCAHDIREFEGRYICCSVQQTGKGNKVERFTKLPANFVLPPADVEAEAMKKFEEGYAKMLAKQGGTIQNPNSSSNMIDESVNDEVIVNNDVDDLPFG